MAGRPISVSTANTMISKYVDHVKTLGVDSNKKTQHVTFTLPEIMEWLNQAAPFTDELRICLGIHPDDTADPGRLTVIVWPYKDGRPATQPFDEGKSGGGGGGINPYNDGNSGP